MTDSNNENADVFDPRAFEEHRKKVHATNFALGAFIVEFSQLEFTLRFLVSRWAEIPERHFDAIIGWWDFSKLCQVLKALVERTEPDPDRAAEIVGLINRAKSINDERVKIVHSTWTWSNAGLEARRVSADKPVPKWLYGDPAAIDALREASSEINARIWSAAPPRAPMP